MTPLTRSQAISASQTLGLELPPLTEEEAIRRVPVLAPDADWISDDERRTDVLSLVQYAPADFWLRPASYSGYHSDYQHGLWAHTLGVVLAIETFAASRVQQGRLTPQEVEQARAAAILHDLRKSGPSGGNTRYDHDAYMATVIAEQTDLSQTVCDAVAEHMGPWGNGPTPSSPVAHLLHDADLVASSEQHGVQYSIPEPAPAELVSQTSGLCTVSVTPEVVLGTE